MVAGDIVNGRNTGAGGSWLVPAVGVEIMITSVWGQSVVATGFSTDSVNNAQTYLAPTAAASTISGLDVKMGITNTIFLYWYGSTQSAFSGIQIK
tara:strand:- start:84 stop:368 length:285 start_codon:yes stop_codon:yes gene_type:complete